MVATSACNGQLGTVSIVAGVLCPTHAPLVQVSYCFPHHVSSRLLVCLAGMFVCCLGCAMGLGIGQIVSVCGNYGLNFAAPFTCHAREKMRRSFGAAAHLLLLICN